MPTKAPKQRFAPATYALWVLAPLAVVAMSWYVATRVPGHNWLFTGHYACSFCDLYARIVDVQHVRHGGVLYSAAEHHQYFTYPTAALFLFYPLTWVTPFVAAWAWSAITIACFGGLVALGLRAYGRTLDATTIAISMLLAVLAVAFLPPVSILLSQGQLGSFLALALALDLLVLRGRARGVLTGIAAAVKVYPLVFLVVLLARREWRAAGTAIVSGLATTLLAFVLWPKHSTTFFLHRLLSGKEVRHFYTSIHWRAASSSPYTVFFRPPFGHGFAWSASVGALSCLLTAGLGVAASMVLWRAGKPLSAFVAALVGSTFAAPVVWDHYFVWVVLLPFVAYEVGLRTWTARAALFSFVVLVVPWGLARDENFSSHGFNVTTVFLFCVRNGLLLTTLAILVAALVEFRATSR